MIRNKSRDRILSYGINILILIMIISFCGIPNAFATGIKDLIGLTDNDHEVNQAFGLEHEPERHEDIEVGGLGVSSRPLEYRLEVWRVLYESSSRVVERCIAYG